MNLERKLLVSKDKRHLAKVALKKFQQDWRDAHLEKYFRDNKMIVPHELTAKPVKQIRRGSKEEGYKWVNV